MSACEPCDWVTLDVQWRRGTSLYVDSEAREQVRGGQVVQTWRGGTGGGGIQTEEIHRWTVGSLPLDDTIPCEDSDCLTVSWHHQQRRARSKFQKDEHWSLDLNASPWRQCWQIHGCSCPTPWHWQKDVLRFFVNCNICKEIIYNFVTVYIVMRGHFLYQLPSVMLLWPPYGIGPAIVFFALWFLLQTRKKGHKTAVLWWFLLLLSSIFFSLPNLSRRRLDVSHTSTHGVVLVRIWDAGLKRAARGSLKIQDAKSHQKIAISAPSHNFVIATKACIDNQKKLFKQQCLLQMSPQYGELWPTGGWDGSGSLGHPS